MPFNSNHSTKSTKIAFCLSSFRAGGGEKQLIEIANAFVARGHTVDLLVLKPVGQYADHVDRRVRVISLDAGRMLFSFPKLVAYLRREKPEVLLGLDEYTQLLALAARWWSGVHTRIILRIGNMLTELFERYEGKSRLMPHLIRRFYKKADAIIANSRGVADNVVLVTGIDRTKVHVIFNPKPRESILSLAAEPVAHSWFTHKTMPIVMAVGRLRVQKNFALIVRAFSRVVKEIPSRLVIVGTGREEGRLRELIRELECEDSIFLAGYADNPYSWMDKADIYVAASLWEGLPNALLEAMVCGLPTIAADCSSGPREILAPDTDYRKRLSIGDGVEYAKSGALYAVNDEAALIEAMVRFLADSALRQRYAAASVERSRDFDSQDVITSYEKILLPQ